MKYDGESFVGTLFCKLIERKVTEVSFDEVLKTAEKFVELESKSDPKIKLKVSVKDIKKAAKRKEKAKIVFDKKAKVVKFTDESINAYYQLHWAYEAMSLRLYGDDFAERVLEAYLASKWFAWKENVKVLLFALAFYWLFLKSRDIIWVHLFVLGKAYYI